MVSLFKALRRAFAQLIRRGAWHVLETVCTEDVPSSEGTVYCSGPFYSDVMVFQHTLRFTVFRPAYYGAMIRDTMLGSLSHRILQGGPQKHTLRTKGPSKHLGAIKSCQGALEGF